ncbi:MAG: recombinase family protein [Antricoccus sp.]
MYLDRASGVTACRPELDKALAAANRGGEQLVITRLDRLDRSVLYLFTLGATLQERGIGLGVLEQGIDTTTAERRAMFGMLSVLAELQRELIIANTRDGLTAARVRGRKGCRRPKLTPEQTTHAQELYDADNYTVQQIADLLKTPRSTKKASVESRNPRNNLLALSDVSVPLLLRPCAGEDLGPLLQPATRTIVEPIEAKPQFLSGAAATTNGRRYEQGKIA